MTFLKFMYDKHKKSFLRFPNHVIKTVIKSGKMTLKRLLEIRLPQNLAKADLVIYGLFVTLNFKAGVPYQGPKAIHIVQVILYITSDHILTSWKMAASSVLTVNYRGEALFVNVFVPNKESCLQQNGKFIFMCEKNSEYLCFLNIYES